MPLPLEPATESEVQAIFALKKAVAEHLTVRFGTGPWSSFGTEDGVARGVTSPMLWVAKRRGQLIAMLRLATKKPWAIDPAYFTPCKAALYLTATAGAGAFYAKCGYREVGRVLFRKTPLVYYETLI